MNINVEWYIDNEFTAEQRRGSLVLSSRLEFPIYDENLAKLEDAELMDETQKMADRLHPGFGEHFEEIIEQDDEVVVVRGSVVVSVPVTDDEDAIIEHALDSIDDSVDGGSDVVYELFIHEVED